MVEHTDEWNKYAAAAGPPPPMPDSFSDQVAGYNQLLTALAKQLLPPPANIKTRDEQVAPGVDVRIYTPPSVESAQLPLVLYVHGGGWNGGNLDTEDHLCRTISGGVHCIVVSLGYRKPPPFGLAREVDDLHAGYQYAIQHATDIGANPQQCIVSGGSAGGGLAIALAYRIVLQKEPLAGLAAISPMSLHPDAVPDKYKAIHTSMVENGGIVPFVTAEMVKASYVLHKVAPPHTDLNVFPQAVGAEAFKNFPPTYVFNTDREALRDDGAVLEAELKDAGVTVKRDIMHNLPHYFWVFPIHEGGKEFRQKLVDGIKWILAQAK